MKSLGRAKIIAAGVVAALTVSGCQTTGGSGYSGENKDSCENVGMIIGAVIGGFLGSKVGKGKGQIAGAVAGAALAGLVGKIAGGLYCEMNANERANYEVARGKALREVPLNETLQWVDPDGQVGVAFTPIEEGINDEGFTCKLVNEDAKVHGKAGQSDILYCENPENGLFEPFS